MKKINRIPKFRNYKEEAKFWDTHDVTDYLDEMKFVDIEFVSKQKKEETVTLRIEPEIKKRLEKISKHRGISLSDLARIWFIEKLRSL